MSDVYDALIIGSGPAAVSAAHALLDRGLEVIMVEPGLELESRQAARKSGLAGQEPKRWAERDLDEIRGKTTATTKGVPKKLLYGSDFPYREVAGAVDLDVEQAKVLRSFASGGLSNVWGACILPYPKDEIDAWPFPPEDLDPHYEAVLRFMPHSGAAEEDSAHLPRHSHRYQHLRTSSQAAAFIEDLRFSSPALAAEGLHFFQARLAVDPAADASGCRYCGMCLYGCPWNLIYSSASSLEDLKQRGMLHRRRIMVNSLREERNLVVVDCIEDGLERVELVAKKVFLAAGFIESTRIVLKSLGAYSRTVTALHSDRFTLPFVRFRGVADVSQEQLHTLCQLFIELRHARFGARSVHLQGYTYNDLFKKALESSQGPFAAILKAPNALILSRLLVFFGYLHSDISSRLELRLEREGGRDRMTVRGRPSADAKRAARRVAKFMFSRFRQLGGVTALPIMDAPGGGNHTGGTLPMRQVPGELESDRYGTPSGFVNVHVVDSSVLSSLPGATVTLPVMANANRIAATCEV